MDPRRFGRLVKTLSAPGTRRSLIRLLAAVPVAGTVLTLLSPEEAAGRGNGAIVGGGGGKRHRRTAHHHPGQHKDHDKHKHRHNHHGKHKGHDTTSPEPTCATTCASGCCTGTTCRTGDAFEACGTGGGACSNCNGAFGGIVMGCTLAECDCGAEGCCIRSGIPPSLFVAACSDCCSGTCVTPGDPTTPCA
jgi:hypothetical protein